MKLPYFRIKINNNQRGEDSYNITNCDGNVSYYFLGAFKMYHKLLRRYHLSINRLIGREQQTKKNGIAINFYNTLNNVIDRFNQDGIVGLINYINYNNIMPYYSMDLEWKGECPHHIAIIDIYTITEKGNKIVFEYSISTKDKPYIFIAIMVMIYITLLQEINVYLRHYCNDKEKYYPIIKQFLYSILLMDKDLKKHNTYRKHSLVLRQFYCVRGKEYYKHLFFRTEPEIPRFTLKK